VVEISYESYDTKRLTMKIRIYYFSSLIFLFTLAFAIVGCGDKGKKGEGTHPTTDSVAALYPRDGDIKGVKFNTAVTKYEGNALYKFLNGGAELYIDYDIATASNAEYKADNAIIEVTVYDMRTPEGAFGRYSLERYSDAEFTNIGNEAHKTSSTLNFWKGKYYCKLISFESSPAAEEATMQLGKTIASRIKTAASSPVLLSLLPETSKVAKSEKYFRKHLALNNIHYIDRKNVLNLNEKTEGTVAQYQFGQSTISGFLIKYPSAQDADAAYTSYTTYLGGKGEVNEQDNLTTVKFQNGKLTQVAIKGNYIVGVWDAQDVKTENEFVQKTLASI